jgi:signal recognition particle subunit SRP54
MTTLERQNPGKITESRRKRIAKGCGMKEEDIKQFLMQFEQMKMIMKQFTKMTDGMKAEAPTGAGSMGLKMPRSHKKKKKDGLDMGGMGMPGGFPGMPGLPNMPGGKMPKLPPGFPKGGGFPPGFFGK